MNKLEIDIDTTKAVSALDKLRERIDDDQSRLEAMKKAMDELANCEPLRASIESNDKVLAALEEQRRLDARHMRRLRLNMAINILSLVGWVVVAYLLRVR
jgi:uncharacterized coiled-coil DUF342 family protein